MATVAKRMKTDLIVSDRIVAHENNVLFDEVENSVPRWSAR